MTYRNIVADRPDQWLHGDAVCASYVNTDEKEKYLEFCDRIASLVTSASVNPNTFNVHKFGDFQLWIEDVSYGFPKSDYCATQAAVKKHIEYCMDMYEAFYVE